jgi:hypothetical protein
VDLWIADVFLQVRGKVLENSTKDSTQRNFGDARKNQYASRRYDKRVGEGRFADDGQLMRSPTLKSPSVSR